MMNQNGKLPPNLTDLSERMTYDEERSRGSSLFAVVQFVVSILFIAAVAWEAFIVLPTNHKHVETARSLTDAASRRRDEEIEREKMLDGVRKRQVQQESEMLLKQRQLKLEIEANIAAVQELSRKIDKLKVRSE